MTGLPLHGNRAGPSGGAMLADYELGEEIRRSGSGYGACNASAGSGVEPVVAAMLMLVPEAAAGGARQLAL